MNHLTKLLLAGATIKKCQITVLTANSLATLSVSAAHFFSSETKTIGGSLLFNILLICTVGGWFLPGQTPICPSSSPPQFSGTGGHSSGSYCERYSSLRSHRATPYPGHYPHRNSSTSKTATHAASQPALSGRAGFHWENCGLFPDNYMDNTSGSLPAHDSWSALQIPNSTGMGTLSHSTNSTSNSR